MADASWLVGIGVVTIIAALGLTLRDRLADIEARDAELRNLRKTLGAERSNSIALRSGLEAAKNAINAHKLRPASAKLGTGSRKSTPIKDWELKYYSPAESFLNASEAALFWKLVNMFRGRYSVCPKVRMEDIVEVGRQFRTSKGYEFRRNRVKSRHVDFLLVDMRTQKCVAGVELDGSSHDTEAARINDQNKDKIFKAVNIPLFRIRAKSDLTDSDLTDAVNQIVKELSSR